MNTNYQKIKNYISSIEKYQIKSEDKISINYKLLNEDINNIDRDLISVLLKDTLCKELFFDKIGEVYIFNQNSFIEVMFNTNEYMEGSYTKYENKIGLFLKDEDRIQLNFPYKDCVLVGGMDKEDDKVNLEVFYNEILEKDKINKLFEPKVFHNIKQYSYSKELSEDDRLDNPNNIQMNDSVDTIEFETIIDENGIEREKLKDNLLIKGNNLLGLHSLAKRLSGSIDVIYIDPPYYFNDTKASDSFAYNSNFKLSTWLTFMKNRLEIARELLSDTGVIFISMSEDGNSHLKLLCDDIFSVDNFIGNIHWNKGYGKNDSVYIRDVTENILLYSKKKTNIPNGLTKKKDGAEEIELLRKNFINSLKNNNFDNPEIELQKIIKQFYKNNKDTIKGIAAYDKVEEKTFRIYRGVTLEDPRGGNYFYDVIHPNGKPCKIPKKGWNRPEKNSDGSMENLLKNNEIIFGKDETTLPNRKYYLDEMTTETPSNFVYNALQGGTELKTLIPNNNFPFPKHTSLIKYLINFLNNKSLTILDFFGGSGTTAHAVLSLNKEDNGNRKFILLEQMDYIENITSERIKRSMIKDGYEDSFIYMEMKESDIKELKNSIKSVSSKENLISIINDNFNNGVFINIDNKEQLLLKIEDIYSKATNKSNPLNDSIKLVIEKHMDNNIDYISYEDIEEINVKENEYKLNKSFYEGK